ncbi:IclR family transcriptional regulator [Paenibacillus sp. R14(2021)]|uniref:IclR family transcriptional regulator n=1 Tax=Paenibacillus sp. R14(2021) TaxID=2859228 RepID=UPI00215893D1|nr:IclR family transcriptional regulator [Paenibacillus sp. R14(2021)]
MNEAKGPRLIQSVKRAVDIMNCFDSSHIELSLSEISEKLNLNVSTVHGIINTLYNYSYIDKNSNNGKYKLGLEFVLKAALVSDNLDLKEIGHPYLTALTQKHQETSHLYIMQNQQLFCIDDVETEGSYFILSSKAGGKLPLHASASGKVFLAHMDEPQLTKFLQNHKFTKLTEKTITNKKHLLDHLQATRERGYGIEDEEIERGAYSIAAPIKEAKERVIGTISIIGSIDSMKANEEGIRLSLLEAASQISSRFGYDGL